MEVFNCALVPVTVTFTITPSYTNAGVTCNGTPVTATVTVNPLPTSSAGADQTVCAGTTFVIGGSPSASGGSGTYSYSWSGPGGFPAALNRQGFTQAFIAANPNAVFATQGSMPRAYFLTASFKF